MVTTLSICPTHGLIFRILSIIIYSKELNRIYAGARMSLHLPLCDCSSSQHGIARLIEHGIVWVKACLAGLYSVFVIVIVITMTGCCCISRFHLLRHRFSAGPVRELAIWHAL